MNLFKLLQTGVARGIITDEQRKQLEALSRETAPASGGSAMSNVLFYGGGALAMLAMVVLMAASFDSFGWGGMAVLSVLYTGGFMALVNRFKAREGMAVATSVVAVLPVLTLPFLIFAVQNMMGLWDAGYSGTGADLRAWAIELTAFGMGMVMFRLVREPLQLLPVLVSAWLMLMDVSGGGDILFMSDTLRGITALYGVGVFGLSIWLDMRSVGTGKDLSWWGYIVAATAVLGGLSLLWDGGEGGKLLFAVFSALMVLGGGMLARRMVAVYGSIGVGIYLVYLVSQMVTSLLGAAVILVALAFGVIWLGMQWYRNEQAIMARLRRVLPQRMQTLIELRLRAPL
ncbi:MAG: hypothetical protein GC134_03150 [Proteobacteria bacterium]|nr:hypothetical protein [Pseudomonadota bacterium]